MFEAIHDVVLKILGGHLILSQVETIIAIVVGLLEGQQAGIAAIGRSMPGNASEKSNINRVYRFVANPRVEVGKICEGMVKALVTSGSRVLVATDWTEIGPLSVLVSAVVLANGRAIPIFWTVVDTRVLRKRSTEVEHMRKLSRLLFGVRSVHVLDRGFDAGDFLRAIGHFCKYVVRASGGFKYRKATKSNLPNQSEFTNIDLFPVKRGRRHDLGQIEYTNAHKTKCRLVIFHDHQQKDRWILTTNLYGPRRSEIVEFYARRFRIEESFKDLKDLRNGFALHGYRMSKPDHLSRLLAVMALGYLIVSSCGHYGEENGLHRKLQGNTRDERELATWRVGISALRKGTVPVTEIKRRMKMLPEYIIWVPSARARRARPASPNQSDIAAA